MVLITKNPCALKFGDKAPGFSLPGVDDKTYSLDSFRDKKILVVIFSCNHCPYVQAYEDRMIGIQKDYASRSVQLVAINANDSKSYPEDSFADMVLRSRQKGYNFPYLRDESQAVAKLYDAACTPEVYAFDQHRVLRFHGKIDDNYQNPQAVKQHFLLDALEQILAGQTVKNPESHPIGCSIKWS